MAKYAIEDTTLTAIADALRGQEGSVSPIPVDELAGRVAALEGGTAPLSLDWYATVEASLWANGESYDLPTGEALTLSVNGPQYLILLDYASTGFTCSGGLSLVLSLYGEGFLWHIIRMEGDGAIQL